MLEELKGSFGRLRLFEEDLLALYHKGTAWVQPDRDFVAEITHSLSCNNSKERKAILKGYYDNCCNIDISFSLAEINKCIQRLVGLANVFDYAPANVWLGEFSEEILEQYQDAARWYRRAAALGNEFGMYGYGLLLLNRRTKKPDGVSVKRCFEDAAERGLSAAKRDLNARAEEIKKADLNEPVPAIFVLNDLLNYGYGKGILPVVESHNDHSLSELELLSGEISEELMDIFYTDETAAKLSEQEIIGGALAESFFVGYGAEAMHDKTKAMSGRDIIGLLSAEYGSFELDDYVLDFSGLKRGSQERKRLCEHIIRAAALQWNLIDSFPGSDEFSEQLIYCMEAMYWYGIAVKRKTMAN